MACVDLMHLSFPPDGYKFYRSANNVILCPGNEEGFLPPKYFTEVREFPSGSLLVQ